MHVCWIHASGGTLCFYYGCCGINRTLVVKEKCFTHWPITCVSVRCGSIVRSSTTYLLLFELSLLFLNILLTLPIVAQTYLQNVSKLKIKKNSNWLLLWIRFVHSFSCTVYFSERWKSDVKKATKYEFSYILEFSHYSTGWTNFSSSVAQVVMCHRLWIRARRLLWWWCQINAFVYLA